MEIKNNSIGSLYSFFIGSGLVKNDLRYHRQAIEDFKKAVKINPNMFNAYTFMNISYYKLFESNKLNLNDKKEFDQNSKKIDNLLALNHSKETPEEKLLIDSAEKLKQKGRLSKGGYTEESLKECLNIYEKVLQINDTNVDVYEGMAIAKMELGDYEEAIDFYSKVISLKKDSQIAISSLVSRGKLNFNLRNFQSALDDLNRVIDSNYFFPYEYTFNLRARVKRKLGDNKGADEDHKKADRLKKYVEKSKFIKV
ncbi:hypothetical protein CU311_00145 [Prochlorococcus marinus str. MU1402]|uniref:tetratricopeptide repeat protein n=1 Tax=Prochlorococcus marinus TaxID=1219 RepID=UPI001ADBA4D2|nr:tetratricopeptide repeat protein [Prochlorococcus marinus]MBO8231053.1 tetratricopeptide repeat protein [Prochlorococcus marinus XMU1402]MBW3055821.1 hypothetical protein [Prochlorococcus marinus str. MU1402]